MAKKAEGSFFTKLLIIGTILLGIVLSYSYVIGNSIQPHVGVVEKISIGFFASIETLSGEGKAINIGYNLESNLKISQENKKIFEGSLKIDNAQIYSHNKGLEQNISTDLIHISVNNNGDKQDKKIEKLDIISKDQNVYVSSKKGLNDMYSYLRGYIHLPFDRIINDISHINQTGKYAHINNAQAFQKQLPQLEANHIINQLFVAMLTSNPKQYFQKHHLSNLLKQNLYNDTWIEYVFVENKKISEKNKKFLMLNKNICTQLNPFFKNIYNNLDIIDGKADGCEFTINDITPFIALVSQIYKQGDIEKGNYDFIISQGTNIDIRFTYSNHILKKWNIFVQNPSNTTKILIVGDTIGIKKSELVLKHEEKNKKIIGNVINGTGKISIHINEKSNKINGNLEFQNYLLVDMDVKGNGKISGRDMKLLAVGDYKAAKIDYSEKNNKTIYKGLNISYTENNYKFDYISPKINVNSLYAIGKFIMGYAEKSDKGEVIKEIKYVYNQGIIKGYYRNPEFEGTVEGEILSQNTFQLKLGIKQQDDYIKVSLVGKQTSDTLVEYLAEGILNNQLLFILKSLSENKKNISTITANIDIPREKIVAEFVTKIEKIPGNTQYKIPENIQKLNIEMQEIFLIPNIYQLHKIAGPELFFAGATLGSIGLTTSYLSHQAKTRKAINELIVSDMEFISEKIEQKLTQSDFDIKTLIHEKDKTNSENILRIGGEKISAGEDYMVGTLNYDVLGINQEVGQFIHSEYKVALLFRGEKPQYQILGFLHESGGKLQVLTKGNYIPRTFERYNFEIISPDKNNSKNTTIQIKITQEHNLKVGDMTNLGRILDTVNGYLFIENDIQPEISKIYLLGNDAPTLFIDTHNKGLENGQIVTKK